MFRKPTKKATFRKRTGSTDDKEDSRTTDVLPSGLRKEAAPSKSNEDDALDSPVPKPPALFSFDNDEGAEDFVLKRNKKKVKELKKLTKLEEEAELERQREEDKRRERERKQRKKRKKEKEKHKQKDTRDSRSRYLDKYRDCSSKIKPPLPDSDDEVDEANSKFPETMPSAAIPDSRAVYKAKKRHERLRREGAEGEIPLDDDQKLVEEGVRSRLIREDSDEEALKFYSSKDLVRVEEERRREERNHFLEQEQGDERDVDDEADDWEKQQIFKAVGRHTVPEVTDMDVDMDGIVESFNQKSIGPTNAGATVTVDDILAMFEFQKRFLCCTIPKAKRSTA